ncbi:restriction endonuclease subunit S [Streptococcus sp. 210928-DFI.4.42]|nr:MULTISPECIES: restriction endonuclease subunit S [Streptococcus]MCB6480597.1 restriction endonuclease subunit S [Streptococcus parasanguinis]MCB7060541.1 restriction endonuclease subunit S [Streptococcus sp. 210928-DFI.4.42]MCQ5187457.1 restriction endonuclease subunit S [Streptococcus parasanguinis]
MNIDKKMIKSNIPKIRFNNFKAFWVEKRIADIVKISAGGDVDKVKLKESGKYPVVANALTNKGIVGFYDDYKVKAPAVTVTGRGDVGYAVARHENFTPVVRLLTLQSENIDVDYLENQINSMRILNESTGVPQLTAPQLGNYKVYHPEIDEQSAIGSLFRTLDDLLASYKDNLANYQSLKATMLSKMFPKAGQTVPEIRLDGFEGEWDLIKLGDFCDLITKGTTGKSQSEQGMVNFVKVENLKDNEIYPIVKISEEEHFGSLKRSILYEGDILFSIAGTLGRTAIVKNNILPANTNQALAIIRGYKLDAYFLLVVLSGEVVKDYIRKNPTVGAQPNLSLEQVSSLKIKIPSLDEQQAIGAYFSNLDNLIAAHQEKISQLETLKKKLLQDMFI